MFFKKKSPASVLKLAWLLICITLMAWQVFRCTKAFYSNPMVTNLVFEKFTNEFLPQITVCPSGYDIIKHDALTWPPT